jgi:hypothetical protein
MLIEMKVTCFRDCGKRNGVAAWVMREEENQGADL